MFLPQEIWDLIVDYVAALCTSEYELRTTAGNIALVSVALKHAARKYIFGCILLQREFEAEPVELWLSSEALASIRHLALDYFGEDKVYGATRRFPRRSTNPFILPNDILPHSLIPFSGLRSLAVKNVAWNDYRHNILCEILIPPPSLCLRSLHLDVVILPNPADLCTLISVTPTLAELELDGVFVASDSELCQDRCSWKTLETLRIKTKSETTTSLCRLKEDGMSYVGNRLAGGICPHALPRLTSLTFTVLTAECVLLLRSLLERTRNTLEDLELIVWDHAAFFSGPALFLERFCRLRYLLVDASSSWRDRFTGNALLHWLTRMYTRLPFTTEPTSLHQLTIRVCPATLPAIPMWTSFFGLLAKSSWKPNKLTIDCGTLREFWGEIMPTFDTTPLSEGGIECELKVLVDKSPLRPNWDHLDWSMDWEDELEEIWNLPKFLAETRMTYRVRMPMRTGQRKVDGKLDQHRRGRRSATAPVKDRVRSGNHTQRHIWIEPHFSVV